MTGYDENAGATSCTDYVNQSAERAYWGRIRIEARMMRISQIIKNPRVPPAIRGIAAPSVVLRRHPWDQREARCGKIFSVANVFINDLDQLLGSCSAPARSMSEMFLQSVRKL